MKKTKGEKIFEVINVTLMLTLLFVTIYPLWQVLIASISNSEAVSSGSIVFKPVGLNFDSYYYVFNTKNLWVSYGNTVFYSVFGCLISMVLTCLGSYGLSKKRLRGRKFLIIIIMVTMWFGAGIMPVYLNIKNLGLLNTRTGILLHGAVSAFYMILMRTYFESIPEEMEESAKIDGASDFMILRKIYIPLSTATLMTISLYYFVGRWNSYFWSMILLTDEKKIPLQVLLKKLVVEMNTNFSQAGNIDYSSSTRETIVYATIVISTVPMIVLYPFIQKFFTKGIMIGAVKG